MITIPRHATLDKISLSALLVANGTAPHELSLRFAEIEKGESEWSLGKDGRYHFTPKEKGESK